MKKLILMLALGLVCAQAFAGIVWQTKDRSCTLSEQQGVYLIILKDLKVEGETNAVFIGEGLAEARKTLEMIDVFFKSSKEGELKIIKEDRLKFVESADLKCIARNKEDMLLFVGDTLEGHASFLEPAWVLGMLEYTKNPDTSRQPGPH